MRILGISGIDGTVDFKRRHWPTLDEREYRISQGHDSAAALVIDGEPVAAVAEERICRRKHTGEFPAGAVASVLTQAGIEPGELDEVVHSFDYGPHRALHSLDPVSAELYDEVLSPQAFGRRVAQHLPDVPPERVRHLDHHQAHAASAYLTSGWEECLVVVVDGMGEAHGATVYLARAGRLEPVHRIGAADSIGILYSLLTLHLGFAFNADEYKVMGLAPYGDRSRFGPVFDELVELREDGGWRIPLLRSEGSRSEGSRSEGSRAGGSRAVVSRAVVSRTVDSRVERERHAGARRELTRRLVDPREPEGPMADEHRDLAAALQACLDRALLHLCGTFARRLGQRRLALAGGVALNSTANARLVESGLFESIYVQPAAADDGTSLGSALWRAALSGEVMNRRSPTPFYGPEHDGRAVRAALARSGDRVCVTGCGSLEETCELAAELIAAGEVVAWYRGRMEFGPRALGNRSILADPRRPEMRERVNSLVKLREAFRPFAPAVTVEQAAHFFEPAPGADLRYMNVNVQVRPEHRSALPATTHVDGSARVQTVSRSDNAQFHTLLEAVGRHTGAEVVLNTSFNVRGQPIVDTPEQAVETFLSTGIEALFLGNLLVRKRPEQDPPGRRP